MKNEIDEKEIKKSKVSLEHVALEKETSQIISDWLIQAAKKRLSLSRKELINWLVQKSPKVLSNSDLNALHSKFYDEDSYLRQLLRERKRAKENGEVLNELEVIVRPKKAPAEIGLSSPVELSVETNT